jgi:O-antigen/teichoic acid export membrane protein
MTATGYNTSLKSSDLGPSAVLLTGANLVCAVIGVVQGLLVLRMLGPETFGAAAVVVALTAVATNLVDVRLMDLISNLYYNDRASCPDTGAAYRASALRLGLRLYVLSAVLIAVASAGLMFVVVHRLTGVALMSSWLWAAAAAQGVSYLGSFFIFIQRFTVVPRRMALLQLMSAAINATAMVASVAASQTVGGYVIGLLASATGIALLNAWYTVAVFRREGVSLVGRQHAAAPAIDRRVILGFVAAGNLLGYVKLLHRAADVLLVAVFCSDRETGIYKLARSITDALLTVSEAIGRIYQPRLLALLQARDHTEYCAVVRSMMTTAAAVTVAAIGGALALLPSMAPVLGVADGQGLTLSVVIMTLTFFFVAGLQSWIWPAFVFAGRMGRCTLWGTVAVLAGQYTVGPALVYLTGYASATWFSLGYLSFYLFSTLPLWRELRSVQPIVAWPVQEVATP